MSNCGGTNPTSPNPPRLNVLSRWIRHRVRAWLACGCAALPAAPIPAEAPSFPGIPATLTVDVRVNFSAKGDGVTDDTKAIQNAIDRVAAQGGGTVFIPAGTYLVNSLSDTQANTLPKTDDAREGPNGFTHQLWLKSRVRLLGEGGRLSILRMPAGSPIDPNDRAARRNRAIAVIGDPTFGEQHPDRWQSDIEIAHLGFDLDNGIGRRALQIRAPARNVRIHHCEGFQSALEQGIAPIDGLRWDNHFINMASAGLPERPIASSTDVTIPENVTIDHCNTTGLMQLVSDGGAGSRNLWIHHNRVENALSNGIALTSTGACNALFEDVVIEDNTIESPSGSGVYVGENYIPNDMDLTGVKVHSFRRITIRRNTIHLRSTPLGRMMWSGWAPNASGIVFGGGLLESRDVRIEDNTLIAENSTALPTSRQAFRVGGWDFNWQQKWMREHGGSRPVVGAGAFDATSGAIFLSGHGLVDGMSVQLRPTSPAALPEGLDPYRAFVVTRLDRDRFTLSLPDTKSRITFGRASPGNVEVIMLPILHGVVIARNRVEGIWDWDAAIWGSTKSLTVDNNVFSSRFVIEGSHEQFKYTENRSTGTMSLGDCTMRAGVVARNSWTVDENISGPQIGPGIVTVSGATDQWRSVEASFEANTFSFRRVPGNSQIFAALWMNRTAWRAPTWPAWPGSATLQISANRLSSAETLAWSIEPQFVSAWNGNPGTNARGPIAETTLPTSTVSRLTGIAGKLSELSVRAVAGRGNQSLIVGFTVAGADAMPILVRGIGPALTQFGVLNPVADPQLEMRQASEVKGRNDNWWQTEDAPRIASTAARLGAFSLTFGDLDAAMIASVNVGSYTVQCSPVDSTGGQAMVELYAANNSGNSRLTNLSALARVGTDGEDLFAGFSIEGGQKTVVIRAVGPGLAQLGVAESLAAPKLVVRAATVGEEVIATNSGWGGATKLSQAFAQVGAFPLQPTANDAAVLIALQPGTYTAHVSGNQGATGLALIEVYEVP